MNFDALLERLLSFATDLSFRILGAIGIFIIGRLIIRRGMGIIKNSKSLNKPDPAVSRFLINSIRVSLNTLLVVSVIAILGIPMTSALALLTSAGVAIGLALQGALGNLAGGIMILMFHPFHLGDYIEIEAFRIHVICRHQTGNRDRSQLIVILKCGTAQRGHIPLGTAENTFLPCFLTKRDGQLLVASFILFPSVGSIGCSFGRAVLQISGVNVHTKSQGGNRYDASAAQPKFP